MRCLGSEAASSWLAVCQVPSLGNPKHLQVLAKQIAAVDWQHKQGSPAGDLAPSHQQHADSGSADSVHLAQCLAELSLPGDGNYDTHCLLSHSYNPAYSSLSDTTAASDNSSGLTVLQATAKQALPDSLQRLPGLAQAAVAFTQDAADDKKQLLVLLKPQHSLGDILRFSPQALQDDEQCRMMLFEVLLCLHAVHAEGLCLGNLTPDSVWLTHGRQGLSSMQDRVKVAVMLHSACMQS